MPGKTRLVWPQGGPINPQISNNSLPSAEVGALYSVQLSAIKGVPPYTFALVSAAPDTGNWLACSPAGLVSGTPGTVEAETAQFSVADSLGNGSIATFGFSVISAVQITTTSPLPTATVGATYSVQLAATGGQAPYNFVMTGASPNAGHWLTCSSSGLLSGTPGTAEGDTVNIQVTDALGGVATATFSLTVQAGSGGGVFNPAFPRIAIMGIGGNLVYGYHTYNTFAPASNPITATMGRFDFIIHGASYEGWGQGGQRTAALLCAGIKGGTGHGNGRPTPATGTKVVPYALTESTHATFTSSSSSNYKMINGVPSAANDGRPVYSSEVSARNWWGWNAGPAAPGTINLTPGSGYVDGSTTLSGIFTDSFGAVPVNGAVNYNNGVPYAGKNPSGEDPWEFGANYFYNLLIQHTGDSRFSGLNLNDATTLYDGIYFDDVVRNPGNSQLGSADYLRTGSSASSSFDGVIADSLAAGFNKMYAKLQSIATAHNTPLYNVANYSDYGRSAGTGVAPYDMNGVVQVGFLESMFGSAAGGWDNFNRAEFLQWVTQFLNRLGSPGLAIIDAKWIASPPTVNVGTVPTDIYQLLRYSLAFACLYDMLLSFEQHLYEYNVDPGGAFTPPAGDPTVPNTYIQYFDEYDNSGSARGWLGFPVSGSLGVRGGYTIGNGVLARDFTGGRVLYNPPTNGVQTLTTAQLGNGTYKCIAGIQKPSVNTGKVIGTGAGQQSSVTLGNSQSSRDGLFLVHT